MKRLAFVAALALVAVVLNIACDEILELDKPGNFEYEATDSGNALKLTWSAVTDAAGYRVKIDGTTEETSNTEYTVDTPAKMIEVTAYNGAVESDPVEVDCEPVITTSIEVYGVTDPSPDHPSGFGFKSDGAAVTYAVSDSASWPVIDYVMDDKTQAMSFRSPNAYTPPLNAEDNTTAEVLGTTDFDAAKNADGDFYNVKEAIEGAVYYFWIDPNANDWDLEDHFAKAKVESFAGTKVVLKLAYQTVPGLSWLVTD
jgi:hypothetical protein